MCFGDSGWWVLLRVGLEHPRREDAVRESLNCLPSRCRYWDSRPLFIVAVHDGYIEDSIFDVCVRPCGFVPPSVDEGSTHVSVCKARPVQRGYANQISSLVVVFLF